MSDNSNAIYAGIAAQNINPPEGMQLIGFPGERANTGPGPLDLMVRCLTISESDKCPQAIILVLDNLGLRQSLVDTIREKVSAQFGGLAAESVMVCATHTHSAPSLIKISCNEPGKFPDVDQEYTQKVIEDCCRAAVESWSRKQSVTLSAGKAAAKLSHNRRVVGSDGKAVNHWLDPDGTHPGVTNDEIPFISFNDPQSGKPIWLLASYACHPVTMGPSNIKLSPDYPGEFIKSAIEITDVKDAIFITGPGADINPLEALTTDFEAPARMGQSIAREISGKLAEAKMVKASPIATYVKKFDFTLSESCRQCFVDDAIEEDNVKKLTTDSQAIRIGDIVIVSAPGELFTEIGMNIESKSPAAFTIVASYTNDYLGYLFTDKALIEGGYEAKEPLSLNIEKPFVAAALEAVKKAYS